MTDSAQEILSLERAALERWAQGDPDGCLDLSASDVTYFDPFVDRRLDGVAALRSWYDQLRGKIHIDRYEIIDPHVQQSGDIAVLTFRFDSHGSEGLMRWNTTEIYQKRPEGWKLIHTHWAFHQPKLAIE